MFLIVGLGNPGDEYNHTRHNVGFDAVEKIADKYNINIKVLRLINSFLSLLIFL